MTGVKSPYAERDIERRKRLTDVIRTEGKDLINNAIRERFPWAGKALISKLRKQFAVKPPSRSCMLSTKDMVGAKPAKSDRFGSRGNGR